MAKLVNRYSPQILFFMETKKKQGDMEWFPALWRFDGCLVVDSKGKSDGLVLL